MIWFSLESKLKPDRVRHTEDCGHKCYIFPFALPWIMSQQSLQRQLSPYINFEGKDLWGSHHMGHTDIARNLRARPRIHEVAR